VRARGLTLVDGHDAPSLPPPIFSRVRFWNQMQPLPTSTRSWKALMAEWNTDITAFTNAAGQVTFTGFFRFG
jgi:hypothetical protein